MTKLVVMTTREKLHQELCKSLDQAIKFGNYNTITSMIKELPEGVTKAKILLWIESYSPLHLISIKPIKFKIPCDAYRSYDKAILFPYWEIKLPVSSNIKPNIKAELIACMSKFISDPSDAAHSNLIQVIKSYKLFGNSPVKKKLKITPANLLQGGIPS